MSLPCRYHPFLHTLNPGQDGQTERKKQRLIKRRGEEECGKGQRLWNDPLRMQLSSDPSGTPEERDWPVDSSGRSLRGLGSGSEGKGQRRWTRTDTDSVEKEWTHVCCAARHSGKCSLRVLKQISGI
ncbi:hypothetical protein KOW79_018447 [Hemibagrus wyckioides]|uniref:Uncharacterized protein n=1 Tax=Hemibagrus wyckioides TaxID=337641 RepID=A0A9D3ND41_9TELE|nr:hypothetical protein KOW79_018447 [Hemibagrus wyckioides]